MKNKNVMYLAIGTVLVLLIPLILTLRGSGIDGDGWHWTLGDFIFAFVLIFGTSLAYQLITKRGGTIAYRAAVGIALLASFLLIWINAAVGILGNENNPANLMYFGVLLIGLIGAFITRLKSHGMATTLFVMAIAQILVPVIALIIMKPQLTNEPPGTIEVFILNAIFAAAFAGSALLFRCASMPGSKLNQHLR